MTEDDLKNAFIAAHDSILALYTSLPKLAKYMINDKRGSKLVDLSLTRYRFSSDGHRSLYNSLLTHQDMNIRNQDSGCLLSSERP